MVRIIVGVMVAYSQDKISKEDVLKLIDGEKIEKKYKTFPAKGLCLKSVRYN